MEIDREHFDSAIGGLKEGQKKILKEIKYVHSDLIEHDKRANTVLQSILDLQTLQIKVEKIRQVIREQLNVEV